MVSENLKFFSRLSRENEIKLILFLRIRKYSLLKSYTSRNLHYLFTAILDNLWNLIYTPPLYVSIPSTYFPISGLSVSMSISSSVNGSSGGIPSSGMPLRIRARNFSRNLLSLNSRPFDAALSTAIRAIRRLE